MKLYEIVSDGKKLEGEIASLLGIKPDDVTVYVLKPRSGGFYDNGGMQVPSNTE